MLENEKFFTYGLCAWVNDLNMHRIINSTEWDILRKYIQDHRPWYSSLLYSGDYYWTPGNIKPRIRWIKKHIKKND